jgi:aryl-alcohol dehydrogenase-like predicted oxidoreductase
VDVESALDDSLRDLDTPYVDLLMMHYPCTFARGEDRFPRDADGKMILGKTSFVETWKAMEKLVKTGKTKAIGVSNFSKGEIQQLLDQSDTVSTNKHCQSPKNFNFTESPFKGTSRPSDGSSPISPAKGLQRMASKQGNPRRPI